MKGRSAEVRERDRRIFGWSIGVAIALHVAVFLLWPTMRVGPLPGADDAVSGTSDGDGAPVYVQVLFGPPVILDRDGRLWSEPPDRVLQANRVLRLPRECSVLGRDGRLPTDGRVRLRVYPSGRANVVALADSTGEDCGDEVITAVAEALWYHWLPNERFPAPVDLIQPVTLTHAQD